MEYLTGYGVQCAWCSAHQKILDLGLHKWLNKHIKKCRINITCGEPWWLSGGNFCQRNPLLLGPLLFQVNSEQSLCVHCSMPSAVVFSAHWIIYTKLSIYLKNVTYLPEKQNSAICCSYGVYCSLLILHCKDNLLHVEVLSHVLLAFLMGDSMSMLCAI